VKNTGVRYVTALLALPLVILLILYPPQPVFAAIAGSLFLIALAEWLVIICKVSGAVPITFGVISGAICITGFVAYDIYQDGFLIFVSTAIMLIGSALFYAAGPQTDMKAAAANVSGLITASLIISWSCGSIILIRGNEAPLDGRHILFLLLSIVWLGDAGAMHIGRRFGKRFLSPVISPRKTVEGLIGALVTGTVAGLLANTVFELPIPFWHVLILSPVIILLSHAGDLLKSIFKRAACVKDSGHLIPGHGGFLDRLDSLLLTAPFLYAYLRLVWLPL